jgi:hypothetical protein
MLLTGTVAAYSEIQIFNSIQFKLKNSEIYVSLKVQAGGTHSNPGISKE